MNFDLVITPHDGASGDEAKVVESEDPLPLLEECVNDDYDAFGGYQCDNASQSVAQTLRFKPMHVSDPEGEMRWDNRIDTDSSYVHPQIIQIHDGLEHDIADSSGVSISTGTITSASTGTSTSSIMRQTQTIVGQSHSFDSSSNATDPSQPLDAEYVPIPILDRQQIDDHVKDGRPPMEETEEFLCAKTDDMETVLCNIPKTKGYEMAVQINPDFMHGKPLLEMFLRSEYYDAERAAHKILLWCEAIRLHFDVEVLGRPLRLTDLSPEAFHVLTLGKFQLLPKPDPRGRFIMVFFRNTSDTYSDHAVAQILLYMSFSTYGKVEVQRRGIVAVHQYDVVSGTPDEFINPDVRHFGLTACYMPVRIETFHYICHRQHPRIRAVIDNIQHFLTEDIHDRFQAHMEPNLQANLDRLATFGFPVHDYPSVDCDGELLVSSHMEWITKWQLSEGYGTLAPASIMRYNNYDVAKTIAAYAESSRLANIVNTTNGLTPDSADHGTTNSNDASSSSTSSTERSVSITSSSSSSTSNASDANNNSNSLTPTDDDILMGRGRPYLQHPGNQFLRSMVADRSKDYDKASRPEKYEMAKDVVRAVYVKKGRFLKIDATAGTWSEVSWMVAREKVAHTFRKRRELDLAKAKKAKSRKSGGK